MVIGALELQNKRERKMLKFIVISLIIISVFYVAYSQKRQNIIKNQLDNYSFNTEDFESFLPVTEIENIKLFNSLIISTFNKNKDLISEFFETFCSIAGYADQSDRYYNTPPEFIPFATMGVDGHMYGYVLLAPELKDQKIPIANFVPIDSDGIYFGGSDFAEFIINQITFNFVEIGFEDSIIDKPKQEKLFELLKSNGFNLLSTKAKQIYDDETGEYSKINHYIPPDYRYIKTSDKVGVAAKTELFDPSDLHSISDDELNTKLEKAKQAYSNGYFATSLFYLKEIYFIESSDKIVFQTITEELKKVYQAMNRGIFVEILDKNLDNYPNKVF
jgi:hypothetical protein